jgi:hypothetical protein
MGFDVASTYERQSDRMTAIVAKTEEKKALLWFPTGEEEWITAADVPSLWRLYERCPACHGIGHISAVQDHKGERPTPPACPNCKSTGRIYP